jgi:hypothetical protein
MRALLLVASLLFAATADAADFVVLFSTGPAWDTSKPPADQTGFKEHSANLRRLRTAGQITLGGRYADKGMIILKAADEASARAEFASDPTIAASVFRLEVFPLRFFYPPDCASAEGNK